jgi:hydroxyacylglutathione hydrolase
MDIEGIVTPGLGDSSYLIASEGEAVLVDPQRDARRFLDLAERRGWRITHVVETHLHNDYVSGALEVRAATGAEVVAPARAGYRFRHRPAAEGLEVHVGALTLVAMETPGHTPEHLAWQVVEADDAEPSAILTGGSLLVGSVGRSDLLGQAQLGDLVAAQFRSLQRLAGFADDVRILPTHGAGSHCVAGPASGERTTTLGRERATNAYLSVSGLHEFRELASARLGRVPSYYARMAAINRRGPVLLAGLTSPRALEPAVLGHLVGADVQVIDARDRWAFAAGNVPGAIHVEPSDSFATWVGSVVPFDVPLAVVLEGGRPSVLGELTEQLRGIGYDHLIGYLDGGMDAWLAAGRPIVRHDVISSEQLAEGPGPLDGSTILDVRQPTEWRDGTIPGSQAIFVGELPGRVDDLPHDRTWTVICRSGARASIAASLLERSGHQVRVVAEGGVPDVLARLAVLRQG